MNVSRWILRHCTRGEPRFAGRLDSGVRDQALAEPFRDGPQLHQREPRELQREPLHGPGGQLRRGHAGHWIAVEANIGKSISGVREAVVLPAYK